MDRIYQDRKTLVIAHTKDHVSNSIHQGPCFILGFMQCTVIFKDERSTDYILIRVFPLKVFPEKRLSTAGGSVAES